MNAQEIILAQITPSTGPVNKAETAVTDSANIAKPEPVGAVWTMLMPLVVIVGLYILFMRPQYKKEKELRESLKKLAKGDRVITRGGIWGTVVGVKDQENIVVVKIADDVKVEVTKTAIETINPTVASVQADKSKPAEKPEKKTKKA